MTMLTKTLLVTTTAALAAFGIAGCATGPTTRAQVCTQFDDLGQKVLAANGFFDNPVFSEAGDLADTARRYPGTPDLNGDASALDDIANSDSTSSLAIESATTHIAALCGHPLGFGTTDYGAGNYGDSYLGASGNGNDDQQAAPPTEDTPEYTPDTPTYDNPETTTPDAADNEASAEAALQQQLATDQPAVESLVGQWVPQLSSKTYGMVVAGVTYDYLQIWQDFETISQAHPGALLLWSSNYSTFQLANYYVTIVPTSYTSGSQAASWCTANGLGANDCYAKLISHTAGPKGATVDP
jgi:hypothetical protein